MADIKEALKKAEELKNLAESMEGKDISKLSSKELSDFFTKAQKLSMQSLKELNLFLRQHDENK